MWPYDSITMLSDGNKSAIVMKLPDGSIMAYVFESVIQDFSLQMQPRVIDITDMASSVRYMPVGCDTKIDMTFIVLGTVTTGDEKLLDGFKTVDNMSILELLEVVQKKAEKRGL